MAGRTDWAQLIRRLAPRYGVDPKAALAVASVEGLSGGVGDNGSSFGPFQLHVGGALPAGRGQAWAESPAGIDYALRQIGGVSRGQTGRQAITSIVQGFERPAAPGAEIQRALAQYGSVGGAAPLLNAAKAPAAGSPSTAAPAPNNNLRQALAQTLLSSTGKQPDLLQVLLSQRLQGGQQPAAPAYPDTLRLPKGTASTGAPVGRLAPTTGYPEMAQQGGKVAGFKFVTAAPQADTSHVDTRLLTTINRFAQAIGKPVTIISGYRSPAYSAKVGGYSSDPHTRGVAVDAYIDGVPIGNVPGAFDWFKKHGVESGAQPGFYRGKTDPEHLQIPGSGVDKSVRASRVLAN